MTASAGFAACGCFASGPVPLFLLAARETTRLGGTDSRRRRTYCLLFNVRVEHERRRVVEGRGIRQPGTADF